MVSYQVFGVAAVKLANHFFRENLFVSSHLRAGSAKSFPLPVGDALETSLRSYAESRGLGQELPAPAGSVPMHETACGCGHGASPEIRGGDAFGAKSLISRLIFLPPSPSPCRIL